MEVSSDKVIQDHIIQSAATYVAKDPPGVKGEGAIAFGGGAILNKNNEGLLREIDPSQFVIAAWNVDSNKSNVTSLLIW